MRTVASYLDHVQSDSNLIISLEPYRKQHQSTAREKLSGKPKYIQKRDREVQKLCMIPKASDIQPPRNCLTYIDVGR